MPFLNLDNNWSSLAQYYNQEKLPPSGKDFLNRPTVPTKVNQYVSFDDGFIRGGFLNATLATTQDIVRVGKFITGLSNISKASDIKDTTLQTATKGILFLTKQLGLQQSNPRLEWQQNPDTIAPLLGGATRQFTGAGVLASIGGSAFGLHFDRAGLLGTIRDDQKYGGDINSTTSGVVWENNFGTGLDSNRKISKNSNNRLVRYLAKIAPPLSVFNPNERFDEFGNRISVAIGPQQPLEILDDEGNKPNLSKILDRYSGGANSVYGLGITTIRTSKDSKTIIDLADIGTPGIPGVTRKYFDGTGEWVEVPNPNYRPPQSTTTTYKKTPNLNEDEKKGQYLSKLANDFPSSTALKSFTVASTVTTEPPKTISEFQLTEKTESIAGTSGVLGTNPELTQKLNGFIPVPNAVLHTAPRANIGTSDSPTEPLQTALGNSLRYWNRIDAPKNIEARVGVSSRKNVDAINVIDITDSNTFYITNGAQASDQKNVDVSDLSAYNGKIDGYYGRDIVSLRLEFLNNDNPVQSTNNSTVLNTDVLAFRAYIDDFSDGMNAKWNSYRYMGRGEDFYVYEGFTRDISLSFTVFAHTIDEMRPLYRKLNYLMSTFAPDYSKTNKMRGNIAYLTVGDYLSRQPGVFTDIKLSGMLESNWEINYSLKIDDKEQKPQNVLPKLIKVGLSFKPIHNLLPRKSTRDNPFLSNFILPSSKSNRSPVDIVPNRYT